MEMDYPTLYFGVELEFNIAYLYPGQVNKDSEDLRPSALKPSADDLQELIKRLDRPLLAMDDLFRDPETRYPNTLEEMLLKYAIYDAIFNAIRAAGLPIKKPAVLSNSIDTAANNFQSWNIDSDITIAQPDDHRYRWLDVEMCSPAYEFTAANVMAVKTVCNTLRANFLTDTNETTGLHVHVSFGPNNKWTFHSLQRVMMFFWAFHDQFDTLHPDHRQGSHRYAQSMRSASMMATDFFEQNNVHMTPIQGLMKLNTYRENDIEGLIRAVSGFSVGISGDEPDRYMAYNVKPVFDLLRPIPHTELKKTTIEFRQHEGTIDGEMVTQWIKVLCGVIRWIERVEPSSLHDLLKVVAHETWSKTGDQNENDQNELQYGSVLAEGPFMITDLLKHMGLQDSADYYGTRLYELGGRPPSDSSSGSSSGSE